MLHLALLASILLIVRSQNGTATPMSTFNGTLPANLTGCDPMYDLCDAQNTCMSGYYCDTAYVGYFPAPADTCGVCMSNATTTSSLSDFSKQNPSIFSFCSCDMAQNE